MSSRYYRREFLNKQGHQAGAYVFAEVSDTTLEGASDYADIEFRVADCYRAITLDFGLYDESERENSLYKLDVLIETLLGFRAAWIIEASIQKRRERSQLNGRCSRARLLNPDGNGTPSPHQTESGIVLPRAPHLR